MGKSRKRTVFLLTGFNNWGKTFLIRQLFSPSLTFRKNVLYTFADQSFCVMPASNDDLGRQGYEKEYADRMAALTKNKYNYIFSAFCPTKEWKSEEKNNDSRAIIEKLYRDDRVVMIPIEHKWCGHAKLLLDAIHAHYAPLSYVEIHAITATNPEQKTQKLQKIVQDIVQADS